MEKPELKPAKGRLLISQPSLTDKFFNHSVVLLAEHNEEGSFGIIINKPAHLKLSSVLKEPLPFEGDLFIGGPVSIDNLYFIHSRGELISGSLKISEGVFWGGSFTEMSRHIVDGRMSLDDVRFFAGYSGWQPRQLAREMKEDSWIVLHADKSYLFGKPLDDLWRQLIISLGDEYLPFVNYPIDPSMN
jgi:putative transcriptional regulator